MTSWNPKWVIEYKVKYGSNEIVLQYAWAEDETALIQCIDNALSDGIEEFVIKKWKKE